MMTTVVMPFDNLFKILRTLERQSPELAEEIILDAERMAQVVGGDAKALAKLVEKSTAEITQYLDKEVLEKVNDILSGGDHE